MNKLCRDKVNDGRSSNGLLDIRFKALQEAFRSVYTVATRVRYWTLCEFVGIMDKPLLMRPGRKPIFDQFKLNVKDITKPEYDDFYLVKWLRARRWDLAKAEKMFRDDEEWRKQNDVDNILTSYQPPEVFTKYFPGGYFGQSKEGYPIYFYPLPRTDQRGFYNCVTTKEVLQYITYLAEQMFKVTCPELSKKCGKRISRVICLADLEGLGLKHLWKPAIDVFVQMVSLAEAHYPDALQAAYAINAPAIFPVAYSLVKPFMAEETRNKIKVIGTNYKEHLLKDIDADQLPVHWGGTATDPDGDPFCRSKICMGGTIPEIFYRKKMLEENNDLSKFTSVTVQKGSTLQLDFPVAVKNSLLSWNFYTDNNDIGFGVCRRTTADQRQKVTEMEAIVPSERVNSHVIPESGRIQCSTPGNYVVCFDNNYSWMNAKKLYYFVEVVEPDSGEGLQLVDSTYF